LRLPRQLGVGPHARDVPPLRGNDPTLGPAGRFGWRRAVFPPWRRRWNAAPAHDRQELQMRDMVIRASILWGILLVFSGAAWAQAPALGEQPAAADAPAVAAEPQKATDDQGKKPPAAVGEEAAKPTRGFVSAYTHNLVDDVKHSPRQNSVYWLGAGVGLALLAHPADNDVNAHLVGKSNPFVAGQFIGQTYTVLGASAAAYIYGRVTSSPRVQHLGMDELEALALAEGIVQGAKYIIRRDRPLNADGSPQSGYAMPSGHATVTFAAATVLQQHLGYKAGIPTYLVASYVAASRLHDNRHYLSDVVMGAATGIIIGRSVTWHGRNFYASPMLVPGGTGIMVLAKR
jgi:membrane-associated phospholipid phosphatase